MQEEEYQDRVEINPEVCGGRPHIRNTRIEITVILDALAEGLTPSEIVDHYPALEEKDVRAAVSYAADLSRENIWKITTS